MTENERHYLIEKKDPSSHRVTILFSEFLTKDQGDRSYAFRHLLSKLRLNIIYVRDPANQWYNSGVAGLGNDLATSASALRKLCQSEGFTHIGCIGASMGGYAALAFGRELGADSILAFAPQTFLARHYPRYKEGMHHGPYLDLAVYDEPPAMNTHIVVSEDELYDVYSALRLQFWSQVKLTMIRRASHLVPRALHNSGLLVGVLEDFCLTGAFSLPDDILGKGSLMEARRELLDAVDNTYLCGTASALPQFIDLLKRFPASAGCHLWAGRAAKAAADTFNAVIHLENAINLNPSLYEAPQELTYIYAASGDWPAAITHAMTAASLNSSYNNLRDDILTKSVDAAERFLANGMVGEVDKILCAIQAGSLDQAMIDPALLARLQQLGK